MQIELVDAVCASARNYLQEIVTISNSEAGHEDRLQKLLLKLHNCASTVGFLSLASTTTAYHDSFVIGTRVDCSVISESLASELQRAEAEWEATRLKSYASTTSPAASQEAKVFGKQVLETMQGPSSTTLRAAVVRNYLAWRY